MTQFEHYIESIKPLSSGSKGIVSAMREALEQMESHGDAGFKFLFAVLRDLASECSWQFGEAVHSTFLEDIPPDTTSTYLSEIFSLPFEKSMVGKSVDPMTFLFDPIFGVDFPQIYGALLGNLLYKIGEKDPSIVGKMTERIREGKLVLTH